MKQLGELSVGDYMSVQAQTIDRNELLTTAIRVMEAERLSILPVIDKSGKLVGILSTSDLINMIHEIQSDISALSYVKEQTQDFLIKLLIQHGDTTRVTDVMTSPVETVTPDTNMVVAARKLTDHGYHHLPVIDDKHQTIGILSSTDFVRAFSDHGATLAG